MAANYIKRVEISKLWGKHDIVWDNLNPDVNILVGINGSGKSTLLKIIYAAISGDEKVVRIIILILHEFKTSTIGMIL